MVYLCSSGGYAIILMLEVNWKTKMPRFVALGLAAAACGKVSISALSDAHGTLRRAKFCFEPTKNVLYF